MYNEIDCHPPFVQDGWMLVNGAASESGFDNEKATVYVVDNDPALGFQVEKILDGHRYRIKTFSSVEQFLERRPPPPVSCLLMDYKLPGMDGLQAQQELRKRSWVLPVVFVSAHGSVRVATEAMKNGAVDFLEKPLETERLRESVDRALRHSMQWHRQREDFIQARQRMATLSARELEVLQLLISGWLNKQIAAELQITERTVKAHRVRIMAKCAVDSLALLVSLALQAGVSPVQQNGNGLPESEETLS